MIPGTDVVVRAYPTRIYVGEKLFEINIEGPLKQFTVMQDLERGCVTVFSEKYRYYVLPTLEVVEKRPPTLENLERLELGVNKKQEWEAIDKRCDLKEILPFWFRLGSLLDVPPRETPDEGLFALLKRGEFEKLFLAGFGDLLVPRSRDTDYQGIVPDSETPGSPLYLLSVGAKAIRALFVTADETSLTLPKNPFASGRFLNLRCPFGELDYEWSKKQVRTVKIRASCDLALTLHLAPAIKRFRCEGKIYNRGDLLEIKSGGHYVLDQFQK